MFSEPLSMKGHLIQAFLICRRQTWLLSRSVSPDQDNDALALGRLLDRDSYARERHQVIFGSNRFDFIQQDDGGLVVCEVKKSSRAEASARMQLAHYLYDMQKDGVEARGLLMFPTEKKREEVELTQELKDQLDAIYEGIREVTRQDAPPPAAMCRYCRKCAWSEYCWADI